MEKDTNFDFGYIADALLILLPPLCAVLLMIAGFWPSLHTNVFGDWLNSSLAYLMFLVTWFIMLLVAKWDMKH